MDGMVKPAGLKAGHYANPMIFADVTNDVRIAQEGIFGPVLVIIPFQDED